MQKRCTRIGASKMGRVDDRSLISTISPCEAQQGRSNIISEGGGVVREAWIHDAIRLLDAA
jgi:hypothetical protein